MEKHALEYNNVALSRKAQLRSDRALPCLLRDNIALVLVLEAHVPNPGAGAHGQPPPPPPPGARFCVATTHIYQNQGFPNVKMWQARRRPPRRRRPRIAASPRPFRLCSAAPAPHRFRFTPPPPPPRPPSLNGQTHPPTCLPASNMGPSWPVIAQGGRRRPGGVGGIARRLQRGAFSSCP